MEKAFRVVEKICVIALGIFAASIVPELFIPAFAIGALIGACTSKQSSHQHHHSNDSGCSHGFFEDKLGVKMPESLALLAGTAVMAVHIDHHAGVFVPIAGLTLGIWAGSITAADLYTCKRNISAFVRRAFS
jgi:hypothetical protein